MRRFFADYAEFFRLPQVARLVVVAFIARMPIGMVGLAMLMCLRDALGSYALAGGITGIYFVTFAVGAPIQGRIIDRHGAKRIFLVTCIVHPAALLAMLLLARAGGGFAALAACAVMAGAFLTPVAVLTRTLWRHLFGQEGQEAQLRRAFAVDAVLIEANYALGPAVVAALLAATDAATAFAVAIVVAFGGPIAFLASGALRHFRPAARAAARDLLGPLAEGRLWLVLAATFGVGASLGGLEVGYPGVASAWSMPALGGLWLMACSIGSALMGALFGGLALRAPIERQFAVVSGAMALPLLLHAWVQGPVTFAVVAFLAGAAVAPSFACQSVLVTRLASARYATEAFTWSSTCIMTGVGTGMALGGWLIETAGPRSPFVAGAAVMLVVAALALALPRTRLPNAAQAAQ